MVVVSCSHIDGMNAALFCCAESSGICVVCVVKASIVISWVVNFSSTGIDWKVFS